MTSPSEDSITKLQEAIRERQRECQECEGRKFTVGGCVCLYMASDEVSKDHEQECSIVKTPCGRCSKEDILLTPAKAVQTEKESFEAMLKRAQVPFTEKPSDRAHAGPEERQVLIEVPYVGLPQLVGYSDFKTQFHFDCTGRLVTVGIWE